MIIFPAVKSLTKSFIFLCIGLLLFIPVKSVYQLDFKPLYTIKQEGSTYTIDLGQEIQHDIEGYKELRTWLGERTKDETVIFLLHNFGGSVAAGVMVTNGLHETKAKTIAVVDGYTYSMGTAIACTANEIKFSKNSFLMFHRARSGSVEEGWQAQEAYMQMNQGCVDKGILSLDERLRIIATPDYEYYYWPDKQAQRQQHNQPKASE